jgi:hypothetical protein
MGIDLSSIFPGIAGLRKAHGDTLLSHAANYIKGVAPFDEQDWLDEVAKLSPDSVVAANLLAEVSGSGETREIERLGPPPDSWWVKLTATRASPRAPPKRGEATKTAEKKPTKPVSKMDTDTDNNNLDDDDEFEVRASIRYPCTCINAIASASRDTAQAQEGQGTWTTIPGYHC